MPAASLAPRAVLRHSALVRVTHWITVIAVFALLLSGLEILISHPRFYLGETGNSGTTPLFQIPIPSSRATVPTGYRYTLPDQNGWSRYLHFEAAWVLVLTGLVYLISGFLTRHFRDNLLPSRARLRLHLSRDSDPHTYNPLQRIAYLKVIFILFPLLIWTGLALSPSFDSAFPLAVTVLGGRQTARTLHFFLTIALVMFLVAHVTMVVLNGFRPRVRGMITGRIDAPRKIDIKECA